MTLTDLFTRDMNAALYWWDTTNDTKGMGDRSRTYFATEYGLMRQYGDTQTRLHYSMTEYFTHLKEKGRIV